MKESANKDVTIVVAKAYDLTLWVLPKVEKLPKSYRFTLGQRLMDASLDLLLALVEAAYRRDKGAALRTASARVNALRYLLRLAKDLGWITLDSYSFASE